MKSSEILREAKRHLSHGEQHCLKTNMICLALGTAINGLLLTCKDEKSLRAKAGAIKEYVHRSLKGHCSYTTWLQEYHPVPWRKMAYRDDLIQQGRHRWVDWLIKQYEAKGD